MKLRLQYSDQRNWWLNLEVPVIPLGKLTDHGQVIFKDTGNPQPVFIRFPKRRNKQGQYRQISNTILVTGVTGSGKSVTAKLVEFFLALERPVIDFDWAGEDSYLCRFPNSEPDNLPPFTKPGIMRGLYLFYAAKNARNQLPYERLMGPNITKYDEAQLEALGFSPGAAMYMKNVLDRYGPFASWDALYDFIQNFPTPTDVARTMRRIEKGKLRLKHNRTYDPNDTMNSNSKESIKKVLPTIIAKGVFQLDDKMEFDFDAAFLAGKNMVFSFNDKDVARVEINYYMQRIKALRRKFKDSPRYFVKIEEAHKVLAGEGKKVDEVIEEFILVCRKASVGLLLVMPTVAREVISDKVLDDIKDFIVGKLTGENAFRIGRRFGSRELTNVISHLRFNRFSDEREFCYISSDEDGAYWTFEPYNSPMEIHREVSA